MCVSLISAGIFHSFIRKLLNMDEDGAEVKYLQQII